MTWRTAGRRARAAAERPAADRPIRRADGAATARHLAAVEAELVELADRVNLELGDAGRPARLELLHAAGRVRGAIAEIERGAGR